MASIESEIQKLAPTALIELFVLDVTNLGGGIERFHAGTNGFQNPVVWQGLTYQALPVEVEGFDITTTGVLPRPKIKVANINGLFSGEIIAFKDLVGGTITRKRTFARFLDAVNFPAGNPEADPNRHFADDIWFVEQKIIENRFQVEWELSSAFDVGGVFLPYRQVLQNYCPWRYRGAECGYTGSAFFDEKDDPVGTLAQDVCGRRLSSCEVRFGVKAVLPYGGFPGALKYEDNI